ncbi:MAG: SCP2 sterol-binding domain-containing protein [Paralcaligenes sp.]
MLPIPSFLTPSVVSTRALNKLLQREDWARARLSPQAGKTARFVVGRLTLNLTVQADGYVQSSDPAIVPDVTLTIPTQKLGRLPEVLRAGDPNAMATLLHVQGDAGLASVVSDLARDLRWDIETDLARVVGDVAAVRVVNGVRSLSAGLRQSGARLAANVGEYLSEETQLLAARPAYNEWNDRLGAARAKLDALETRLSWLESSGAVRTATPKA